MLIALSLGIAFAALLAIAYAVLMSVYRLGWRQSPAWKLPPGFRPSTRVTVVIAARNEAEAIGACLEALRRGSYPPDLLEVIVVDDHSDDTTAGIVESLARQFPALQLLRLNDGEGKKQALTAAIGMAAGELIVTTDADCLAQPDWLSLIVSAYEADNWKAIAAPVMITGERNHLQYFQALDLAGLMGITAAGIRLEFQRLGNGANLAYPKSVFVEVGGFSGSEHRASGDDLFLLQKIARRYPNGIFFLKNAAATVLTGAPATWAGFLKQRLRWGTKNAALPETPVRIVLAIVFLFCWSLLLTAALLPFFPALAWLLLLQLTIKALFDYLFLRDLCRFFHRTDLLRRFCPSFFLHIVYIAFLGLASLFIRRYSWKGRELR